MSDLELLAELLKRITGADLSNDLPKNWNHHFVVVELQFEDGKFQRADAY